MPMNQLTSVLIYSGLSTISAIVGTYLVVLNEQWARKNIIYLISFSAGILLSVSLTRLLPEAYSFNINASIWLLVGFIIFYILEHSLILHSCQESGECEVHPIDKIALFGMGFHSLLDGVIIGIGFEVSSAIGILTAVTILFHKLPDGISITSILLHSNHPKNKTIRWSVIIASMTFMGALISYFLLNNINSNILGILIAIAAGSFLYLASADLIPEIHKKSKFLNIILVVIGALVPFLLNFIFVR